MIRDDGGIMGEYGRLGVKAWILTIAVVAQACAVLLALWVIIQDRHALRERPPLVVRIDQLKRAEAVDIEASKVDTRNPIDAEAVKVALFSYIEKHFSRSHSQKYQHDFADSLVFLEQKLHDKELKDWENDKDVKAFIQNPTAPETIAEANMYQSYGLETGCSDQSRPCEAVIDFNEFSTDESGKEVKRKCQEIVSFVVSPIVRNDQLRVNALGLDILTEKVTRAFETETASR